MDSPRKQSYLVVGLMSVINGLVLYNALFHDPLVGYDALQHTRYIQVLSTLQLPDPAQSSEFFSPPLPYVFPALAHAAGLRLEAALKVGQLVQVGVSVGLTMLLLLICELIRPRDTLFKALALGFYGMPAVVYKTFSHIRGEPWVALLAMLLAYQVLRILADGQSNLRRSLGLGLCAGLLMLARQWGVLVLIGMTAFAVVLAIRRPAWRSLLARSTVVTIVIALLVGGWFYGLLYHRHGTVRAFNQKPVPFSLGNQDASFYFGHGDGRILSDPVRASFQNQLGPILYSEFWGDYWCYFAVWGRDCRDQWLFGQELERALAQGHLSEDATNRTSIAGYLGRVNRFAIIPTALLLAGLVLAGRPLLQMMVRPTNDPRHLGSVLALMIVLSSAVGYLWFLLSYPAPGKGDTIKATYLFHVVPFAAILAAEMMVQVRAHFPRAFAILVIALIAAAGHNAPTLLSRFTRVTQKFDLATQPATSVSACPIGE